MQRVYIIGSASYIYRMQYVYSLKVGFIKSVCVECIFADFYRFDYIAVGVEYLYNWMKFIGKCESVILSEYTIPQR